ncbi:MAG: Tol-Pal system protein TolB [Alphaproteobacteria bacterium]|nr:Tol-Pal system protein TolB [Alphaproteobacteria bacterium]
MTRPMTRLLHSVLFVMVLCVAAPAHAVLKVDITRGHIEPMPVAMPDLSGSDASSASIGRQIMQVVSADLERSGLFDPIDHNAFIEKVTYGQVLPRFADWRQINAQALVTGTITPINSSSVKVGFRLWDVFGEEQIAGKEFSTQISNWRRIAHLIADAIYSRLTGESGYFDSRIAYIAESGPADKRIKRLAIMDQDGENHKFLTDGRALVLTPRFSPNYHQLIYLSYARGVPKVYLRDLETGSENLLGDFKGMTFAPRFAPDNRTVAFSVAEGGNSEIYTMDLRTMKKTRLTRDPGIDTSPCYSPDGRQIVFNSDRGGSQQLYVMGSDGSNPHRISFGDGKYGTPAWSPRGDLIAFTKMHGGQFYIGVMRADGSGERLLAQSYMVEGPTWSPNGRVIMFTRQERSHSRQGGKSHLYSVDVTGYNERELITPMDASDPAWSTLLPL